MVATIYDIGAVVVNANTFTPRRWKGNPIRAESLLEHVRQLFALLQARRTAYVLVGGIALLHYVEGRNTKDIDLIMALPALRQPGDRGASAGHVLPRGVFGELQIDVLLTENRLFDLVQGRPAQSNSFWIRRCRSPLLRGCCC